MSTVARVTVPMFRARKGQTPLVVVTAYDAPQGRLADAAGVDAILIGDSLGMTTLGYDTTLPVTLDDLILHARAVARGQATRTVEKNASEDAVRGARHALLVGDLPFGSYGISVEDGVRSGVRMMQEGNVQAVKVEGASETIEETTRRLVALGVPVMAHVGLTPQAVHRFGGFKVQGRTDDEGDRILTDVRRMADAGAFGVVLELMPSDLARRITAAVPIPTIGIGAGPDCDGQVQVLHDLLGLTDGRLPRHAHRYVDAARVIQTAVSEYAGDVRARRFPTADNSF
ncbi:MAG: 3-methyl-2-oxobutanoate hydroxymethyltransferase [Capsulimonadales bacterium]|nr:3-methyl-2-oxobutanoate hydroxymethyltransferase [Capsulimonadales bacterium]